MKKSLLLLILAVAIVTVRAQTENKEYEAKIFNSWLAEPAQSNIKECSEVETGSSPQVYDKGRRASMLQVNASVVVNGQKRRMTVQFTVYDNGTYRVASGPFFNDYKSPAQRAKEAEETQKRREAEETPYARYLRTGNLEEYQASQAKEKQAADATKQQAETQQRQKEEEASKAAESERVAAAASRLFVANWKNVTGKINPSSNLSVVSLVEPSRVDSKRRYDLDVGYIFSLVFARAENEPSKEIGRAHV